MEILKALFRGADILILDEPTAVLTPQEADELFRVLRAIRAEGTTIVLITHKLGEVRALARHVTVTRDGRVVGRCPRRSRRSERIAELMVGRPVGLRADKAAGPPGETLLQVVALVVKDGRGVAALRGLLHGAARRDRRVAGVAGNGQTELIEAIAGLRP